MALTGFVLIFLSLALSSLQRSPGDGPRQFVQTAGIAFVAFVVGVAVIGLSLLWQRGRSAIVYSSISWFLAAELLLVAIAAGMITWKAVWASPPK